MQLTLTFLSLPLLLWLIAYGIRRGLMPLDFLAGELAARNAQSLQPVSEQVPAETLPLVQSLNALLARVAESLAREQRLHRRCRPRIAQPARSAESTGRSAGHEQQWRPSSNTIWATSMKA